MDQRVESGGVFRQGRPDLHRLLGPSEGDEFSVLRTADASHRVAGIEIEDIGTTECPGKIAPAASVGAHHFMDAVGGVAEIDHHVGDGGTAFGVVGPFPEEEIARTEHGIKSFRVDGSVAQFRDRGDATLLMEFVVLIGGSARKLLF